MPRRGSTKLVQCRASTLICSPRGCICKEGAPGSSARKRDPGNELPNSCFRLSLGKTDGEVRTGTCHLLSPLCNLNLFFVSTLTSFSARGSYNTPGLPSLALGKSRHADSFTTGQQMSELLPALGPWSAHTLPRSPPKKGDASAAARFLQHNPRTYCHAEISNITPLLLL